jgi:hypothetical protein
VHKELTIAELDSQSVELLPDRETLLFDNNWAAVFASNSSLAVNAATVLSAATSTANQQIIVAQG